MQWSHGDSALLHASAALQRLESENIEEILVLQRIENWLHINYVEPVAEPRPSDKNNIARNYQRKDPVRKMNNVIGQ